MNELRADFDYLPFADGPYRMTMGLMALKPADWIEIDSRYARRNRVAEVAAGTAA